MSRRIALAFVCAASLSTLSLTANAASGAALPNAALPRAALPNAALPSAALPNAALPSAALPSAALPRAALPNAALPSAALPNAALSSAALSSAYASNANASPQANERPSGDGSKEHFRIGPLVGLGFPRPFAIEAFAKIERFLGVGAEYSFLPRMNVAGVDVGFKAIAADLRVFPFRGAFFLGARAGRQWLDARTIVSAGELGSATEAMTASTWFVNPRVGFLFTFQSGITVGIDAGVQLPVNPSYQRTGRAPNGIVDTSGFDQTLASVANALGNNATPTIDILRLGFLF